jgi:hypothetical protein
MNAKVGMAITMFLAATSAWAQSPAPPASPAAATPPGIAGGSDTNGRVRSRLGRNRNLGATQAQVTPGARMQEMQTTLNGMHALLKKMQAKNASSRSKDSVAAANLEMWELLLSHLDREFQQLQIATLAREDMEARRAALYKQADDKAAKEAQAAMGAKTGQTPPASSTAPPSPKP